MNNRELATVIWLGIGLAACLFSREIRGALWQVARSFSHPKVLGPVVALAAWTLGLVVLAHMWGLWEPDARNDTVVWFVTVGVVLYFSLERVTREGFFRTTALRAVAVAVFVEGFVNLAVLSLPVELVLVPAVTFLGMLVAVSEGKEEYASAHRLVTDIVSVIGLCALVYGSIRLAEDFDAGYTVRALVLPVWLTLGVLPLVYIVGLWSAYESAFIRIDFQTEDPMNRRRAKRALARATHVRAAVVDRFAGRWIWELASADTDDEAREVTRRWLAQQGGAHDATAREVS